MGPNSNDEMDPEIAQLLSITEEDIGDSKKKALKEEVNEDEINKKIAKEASDLKIEAPQGFLKSVLEDEEKDFVDTVLKMKKLFENPPSKEDKFLYREKLSTAFWNLYRELAKKLLGTKLTKEKQFLLRFNILDLNWLSRKQYENLKSLPWTENKYDTIYFMDEWLKRIGQGEIKPSTMDETVVAKKKGSEQNQEKLERRKGQKEAELQSAQSKIEGIKIIEDELRELLDLITTHSNLFKGDDGFDYIEPHTKEQRQYLSDFVEKMRVLSRENKSLQDIYNSVENIDKDIEKLMEGVDGSETIGDTESIENEFNCVKQMIKMCVGRQGNHFPILLRSYFSEDPNSMATKENVMKVIEEVEKLDPNLFTRTYRGEDNRIFPYIIIPTCYGDTGVCWEPFSRHNKATSKGRLAIPMFPKSLKIAILTALADLRWQVAKDKTDYHWMEEGLTGKYYQYYTEQKLKGDIKQYFIQDYIVWITMESQGMQKLHRDARPVFWREIPLPQNIKEELKNKGFFYAELYKKDQNIAKSDGYL